MDKDTRQELERLESALLAEDTEKLEQGKELEDFLDGLLDDPADSLAQTGPMVYQNFANGYGQNRIEETEEEPASETNFWLLLSSVAIAIVLVLAVLSIVIRKVVEKVNKGRKKKVRAPKAKKDKKAKAAKVEKVDEDSPYND